MKFFKALFSIVLLTTFTVASFAQEEAMLNETVETNTWVNDAYQPFVSGHINFGSVTDAFKASYGLGVGIQKKYLFFGFFGEMGDLGDVTMKYSDGMRSVDYGILGPMVGFRTNANKRLGFFGSVKGGWGYGNYTLIDGEGETIEDKDGIHLIRPEAGLELKLGNKLRLNGHIGYDFTHSVHENPNIGDADLRKMSFGLSLRAMLGNQR